MTRRWAVFGAMGGIYFAFGIVLSAIPPMITEVRNDLGLTRGEIGFAIGAWALMYIVVSPPAGRFIDRVGLPRSLALGAGLVGLSAAVQGAAQGIVSLWVGIAILGLGGPLISLSAPKLVTTWFIDPGERPAAVGYYTSAPPLGGAVALLLTNPVLLPLFGSWRGVMMAHAVTCVVAAGVWVAVDRCVAGTKPVPPASSTRPLGGRAAARELLASRDVRLAIALGAGAFFITQGLATWLPDILRETSGLSPAAASNWAAASMAIGIGARLLIPGSARPERRSLVLQVCMATLVVAMLVLAFGPPFAGGAAALVLGLRSALNSLVILVLMEADRVTAGNAGLATGLWFSAVQVGGAGGPLAPGLLGDSDYGFAAALVVMAVMLLVMMAILAHHDHRPPPLAGGTV